jgi:hypothetical protein
MEEIKVKKRGRKVGTRFINGYQKKVTTEIKPEVKNE